MFYENGVVGAGRDPPLPTRELFCKQFLMFPKQMELLYLQNKGNWLQTSSRNKNPNKNDEVVLREPKEVLEEMRKLDGESEDVLEGINKLIN